MAMEDVGKRKDSSAQNGLGCRSNNGGGQTTEDGNDGRLSGEEQGVSQLLGLEILLLRAFSPS